MLVIINKDSPARMTLKTHYMKSPVNSTFLLAVFFLLLSMLSATIINVPSDQPTIQAGIDATSNGDTVLVQPGTYVENINFNGKNIVVGSLFLTTGDTAYISQTVIDGDSSGSVVTFENGEDSTAFLNGVTVTNGSAYSGGGIYCYESSPSLLNLSIVDNNAYSGGGIRIYRYSNPKLKKVLVKGNTASHNGGGILCDVFANPVLENVNIEENSANHNGGGMYCWWHSNPYLSDVLMRDNVANSRGGGIYLYEDCSPQMDRVSIIGNLGNWRGGGVALSIRCNPTFRGVIIIGNHTNGGGGGVYCKNNSSPALHSVTLAGNMAKYGAGILVSDNSEPVLENVEIRDNHARVVAGGIYVGYSSTITLSSVTISGNISSRGGGIFIYQNSVLSFDSLNRSNIYLNYAGVGSDLLALESTVSVIVDTFTVGYPNGNHTFPEENFTFDIINGKVNVLDADLYVSPDGNDTNTGLSFSESLQTIAYALLKVNADSFDPHTIFLADGIYSPYRNGEHFPLNMVSDVSLQGESQNTVILDADSLSGVLHFEQDDRVNVENITVTGGLRHQGGGIYCKQSSPTLINVAVCGNNAGTESLDNNGGGIYCEDNSSPRLTNVTISSNTALSLGGGMYCYNNSNPIVRNVTIVDNTAATGGGIFIYESEPIMVGVIMWDNTPQQISFSYIGDTVNSVMIAYSDIESGIEGIQPSTGTVNWIEGNIDADPLFADAENYDFHLQEGSPCIDAGTAFFIWEGDTLVNLPDSAYQGNAPDIGAFESPYTAGIKEEDIIPKKFALHQNYPNPFNPITTIRYDLPELTNVRLTIYDLLGREVRMLVNGVQEPGFKSIIWDGKNNAGQTIGAGLYFYLISANDFTQTRKMLLIK